MDMYEYKGAAKAWTSRAARDAEKRSEPSRAVPVTTAYACPRGWGGVVQ